VVARLVGFRFANRGALALQAEYLLEYGRITGLPLKSRLVRSTFDGAGHVEWHYMLEPTSQNIAALRVLPTLDDALPIIASIPRSMSVPPRSR
jgi:hypothetical protein